MNDISSVATTIMGMQQSQTQQQVNVSLIKMKAEADQAMADMILQNAREIAALSHAATGGVLDLFA